MQITILGLGAMGSRMALRLLHAGHMVTVYNRSSPPVDAAVEAGAMRGVTPRSAVEGSEIVIAMIRDDDASRAVWCDEHDGALKGLSRDAIAIESSTLTPTWVKELAAKVHATGAAFLDAPVLGSRPQADAGQLIHLVGGDKRVFDRTKDVLSTIGTAAHLVGSIGSGATLKLAVNTIFGTQVAILSEMLALLQHAGLNPSAMVEILASLPITSPAAKGAATLMLAKADAPLFPIELVEKDFAYTLSQAGTASFMLPITSVVHELFAKAQAQGFGASNITAVARLY
jgi:3-hydroxyisobutyrate dehydrogenase